MSTNKTQPTNDSVEEFLNSIVPPQKQNDCRRLTQIMTEVTGHRPIMWGSIVGFGSYHYKYASGREGDFFLIGFAPRSKNITIYVAAYDEALDAQKRDMGKVKLGKGCIYLNGLEQISEDKLVHVLRESIRITKERYPA